MQALLDQVEHLRPSDRHGVDQQRDRLRVKVAGGVQALWLALGRRQEHGAVGDGAQLTPELGAQLCEQIERRSVDLRDHAQGDRRLHRGVPPAAARQQLAHATVDAQLSGVALQFTNANRVGTGRGVDRRHRQRSCQGGMLEQRLRPQRQRDCQRRRQRSAVDQRDPLLGTELIRCDPPRGKRAGGGCRPALAAHLAFAHERLEQMRELDCLAGGATRAGRDDRQPAVVEPVGDEPAQLRADAGAAAEKADKPQQHRPADDRLRQWRADRGGSGHQDGALKDGLVLGLHRPTGEVAETGVDAVGGTAALQVDEHRGTPAVHLGEQLALDLDPLALERDPAVGVEVELVVSGENQGRLRH
jgi:hypothetical protein